MNTGTGGAQTGPGDAAPTLDLVRPCLEGVIPAVVATCAPDGTPNATYVSQMSYVDAQHAALSFQFFSKTRENILANPQATALVIDPVTGDSYRLALLYLRTETEGPLFQSLKARLAGIASHTGMTGVFRLQGADIYRVQAVERIKAGGLPRPPRQRSLLGALRRAGERLAACADLERLFEQALAALADDFGIRHALLLMADLPGERLYTVASRGYHSSGVGAEIAFGDGVIGVAAQHRVPIRINHMTMEYRYGALSGTGPAQGAGGLETAIPFPGLGEPHSQLAVPVCGAGRLLGVLCVESGQDLAFTYDDEDVLVALAQMLGAGIVALQQGAEAEPEPEAAAPPAPAGPPLEVRHYGVNRSVFVDGDYLIKGVAGAILWKLLQMQAESGRCSFSNRELRAMPDLGLPEVGDNLEARLVLLQRRLAERCPAIVLERVARGQLRLALQRPLRLVDAED